MCGYPTQTRAYDTKRAPEPGDGISAENFPELREAFMAWKAGAYEQMVEESLKILGITTKHPNPPQGLVGWTIDIDSATLYIAYDRSRGEVTAEAPVVWVPEHQRVALMRALLELNLWALQVARFCLHGDVAVLRFADRAENLSPPKLLSAVREVGSQADRHDNWLAMKFGARMVGPEAQRARSDWSFLGSPVELKGFEQISTTHSLPEKISPVAGMLDILGSGLDLIRRHDPQRTGVAARLVSRAAVCRAWSEQRRTVPGAATLVLDGGWPVVLAPLGQENAVPEVIAWLERLRGLGDKLRSLAPAPAPPIPELDVAVRQYVALLFQQLEALPNDYALHKFILLGGLGEVLVRAPIGTDTASRLTYAVQWGLQVDDSTTTCQQLANVLRELA